MRLYSGLLSMFGAKAEIAALEKGLPVKVFMVPYDPQQGYKPKHPDVLAHQSQAPGAGADRRRAGDFRFHSDLRIF